MSFVWNPWAIPGILGVALAAALAAVVYRAGPRRPLNRALALLLAADAVDWGALVGAQLTDDPATAFAWVMVHFVADIGVIGAYLVFVGLALDTPLARPFRTRPGRSIVLGTCALAAAVIVLRPGLVLVGAEHTGRDFYPIFGLYGPWLWLLWTVLALTFTYGLVAAVHARARAASLTARRRANAYLWAFGLRDAILVISFGRGVYELAVGQPTSSFDSRFSAFTIGGVALYVAVLGYAILKEQLLDIDLKLKWTIRRGTLVGIFVAVFVVVAAIVEQWLQQYGILVGGLAVGAMLLALRPLERAANRFADAAMPRVQDTPEYFAFRKLEVYKGALEGAAQDGEITAKERDILARLRNDLGIAHADADAMERDVLAQTREAT